jgi:hypothetical protein
MTLQDGPPDLLATVAEVLRELNAEIEALGASLCADPAVAAGHGRELQAIDLVAQTQSSLAELLTAGCAGCAVERVRIDSLRDRLRLCFPAVHECQHG